MTTCWKQCKLSILLEDLSTGAGLRLRVISGESGEDQNADGESGGDSISNSPQGEFYLKLAGGGGGVAATLHSTNCVKSASDGNGALAGDAGGELAEGVHCGGDSAQFFWGKMDGQIITHKLHFGKSALFPAPPLQIQLAATSVTDLRGAK